MTYIYGVPGPGRWTGGVDLFLEKKGNGDFFRKELEGEDFLLQNFENN